ncbi:hypothetical protein KJZ61_01205 [Candidatus Dependentiae bacterium]|nr:hypothetical protein [Candidatus Dependentiae bacterium]
MNNYEFKSILIHPLLATAITFLVGFSSLDLHADPNTAQMDHIIFAPGLYNKGSRTFGCIPAKSQTNSSIFAPNASIKSIDSIGYDSRESTTSFTLLLEKIKTDLGQENCIKVLNNKFPQTIGQVTGDQKFTFCGVSQGAATLINWLAENENMQEKVAALILEGPLVNANSAAIHCVDNYLTIFRKLSLPLPIPFMQYWLPWALKLRFPTYNPLGIQALTSACKLNKIPDDAPIIILHNKGDKIVSINDARKLYTTLREKHENTHIFEIDNGEKHINVLSVSNNTQLTTKTAALETLRKIKHILPSQINQNSQARSTSQETIDHTASPTTQSTEAESSPSQPDPKKLETQIQQETRIKRWIRNGVDLAAIGLISGYAAYRLWLNN